MSEISTVQELEEFRQSMRGFLGRRADMKTVRVVMDTTAGFDEVAWSEAASQVGLQALVIPESFDGAGFTAAEQAIAMEELGGALAVGPYLSSAVLATNLIVQSSDEPLKQQLLPELASGELRLAAALAERSWQQGVERPAVRAYSSGNEWNLSGVKNLVLDGSSADGFIVSAVAADGASLFFVDGAAPGITRALLPTVDLTRRLSTVEFASTPARLIGAEGSAAPVLERAINLTVAALASEQVGSAARALQITVDYLKVREQFGRPLASFQALKHRAADMLVEIETARAIANAAALAGALENWTELATLAALAKTRSWEVLDDVSAQAVQLHGGVGFTWDFDPHLYFKRARGNQFLFGDLTSYRERVTAALGL